MKPTGPESPESELIRVLLACGNLCHGNRLNVAVEFFAALERPLREGGNVGASSVNFGAAQAASLELWQGKDTQ